MSHVMANICCRQVWSIFMDRLEEETADGITVVVFHALRNDQQAAYHDVSTKTVFCIQRCDV